MFEFPGTKEVVAAIAGLAGAAVGGLAKVAWDHFFSERTASIQKLLERLADNQQALSSVGRGRLQAEAEAALCEWQRRLGSPAGSRKLGNWPKRNEALFARPLNTPEGVSACPAPGASGLAGPLFIRLEASDKDSSRFDSPKAAKESRLGFEARAANELRERLKKIADEVMLSEKLLKMARWRDEDPPRLWVLAPEVAVHSGEDARRLLQKLAEEARSWVPGVKVILEIYLPEVVRKQIGFQSKGLLIPSDSAASERDGAATPCRGARYAAARDEAESGLSDGMILGDLQRPDRYSISKAILEERLHKHFQTIVRDDGWTTVAVSGAPGTGKTELSGLLAQGLASSFKAVVLVFSTPELLTDMDTLRKERHREDAYFGLVKAFCFRERLAPARFHENVESMEAFADALLPALSDERRRQPLVFVVDDLHARREIRDVLLYLRAQARTWRLRFLLIGRTEIERCEDEGRVDIKCEPWNRKQAQRILTEWVEKKRQHDMEIALGEGWLAEQKKFSIYLLRLIAENVDDLTAQRTSPSSLLRSAIDKHLSSVTLEVRLGPQPSSDLLLRVENMLRNGAPAETVLVELRREEAVDLVKLLGVLSWVSHFEAQDTILTPAKIRHWSQGVISTDQEARELIDAGWAAGVFSKFRAGAMWHDKLVADGCAALYLGQKVEDNLLDDSLIAEMIESLNNSDSIDILTLALDTPVLLRIIEAVANARLNLADAINKLVTTEFVMQLKRNREWLFELWEHLWKRARRAGGSVATPFALVLARLLPLDPSLEARCREAIAEGSSDEAVVAIAVKARQSSDTEQFFKELGQYAPPYLSPVMAEAAARCCTAADGRTLHAYLAGLVELGVKESDIGRFWELWCARQEIGDILAAVNTFVSETKEGTAREDIYGILTEVSLKAIAVHKSPAERNKHIRQINHLKSEIIELARRGKKLASLLAKWSAYFHSPDIVDREGTWVVVTGKANYALPKRPNEPLTVSQIFARIRNGYPDLELAASGELRHVRKDSDGCPELVRDRLPPGFSYTKEAISQIPPACLLIWSERPLDENIVTIDKVDSMEVSWRPRLNLMN